MSTAPVMPSNHALTHGPIHTDAGGGTPEPAKW